MVESFYLDLIKDESILQGFPASRNKVIYIRAKQPHSCPLLRWLVGLILQIFMHALYS